MDKLEKLRVMHVITDLAKGGAERFLIDLCTEHAKSESIEFIIVSLLGRNEYESTTKDFKVYDVNFQLNSLGGKAKNKRYAEIIEEFKPHLIHSHRFLGEFITSEYVSSDIAYVCHGHDNMIQLKNFNFSTLLNRVNLLNFYERSILFYRKYLRVKTHFIVNSEDTLNYFNKALWAYRNKEVVLIPLGFNYDKFYLDSRKEIDQNETIKILNVGSFVDKKNQIFITKIAQALIKRNVKFEMNLAGVGVTLKKVKREVERLGLNDYFNFFGLVDNVESLMQESNIYLHTAWYEPFGLVFLEAMASGLPIVTLNGRGNEGLIEDGFNGFIIKEQNEELFADKVEYLLKDKDFYKELSNRAREFSKTYDIRVQANKFLEYYQKVRKA